MRAQTTDGSGGSSNHRDARATGMWTGLRLCAERRGDRQRSEAAMISIMAAAPGMLSSGAAHSTPQTAAPARPDARLLEAHHDPS
jgi:hypothetical protein